ncbi:MAG: DUF1232 domain-containing protein [Muribaculaceae bacterium]|nr:DUF1232 domain-containing protein [Muribaculaceae bacterium]
MNITLFKRNLKEYAGHYNAGSLFEKLKTAARKAGKKTVHLVLILYYATFDKALPVKDRLMVLAALGYFILPVDMIPDVLPGGFADDAAALLYVVRHIWRNLSNDTFSKARLKLDEWFGASGDPDVKH